MIYTCYDAPIGRLTLVADDENLVGLHFAAYRGAPVIPQAEWVKGEAAVLREAVAQLDAYFAGDRREFDLPLQPRGTEFQQSVWQELRRIPFGETICYGELARRVGNAKASRAVGMANGRNPIAIMIPCHRVIGASGSLTGFGGGVDVKRQLLELEGWQDVRAGELFAQAAGT